jgi:hypothetical protein
MTDNYNNEILKHTLKSLFLDWDSFKMFINLIIFDLYINRVALLTKTYANKCSLYIIYIYFMWKNP